jgi:nuclear pore complex protein Nup205
LGQDILTARLESLKYERRTLAIILFLISRSGHLRPVEIQKMVEWLSSNPNHAMTFYILTSTLSAFDPVDLKSSGGKARNKLAHDKDIVQAMTKLLGPATNWKDPSLKATVLLKWTLFSTQVRQRDPDLEFQSGFKAEELEAQVWNAVQGGAFSYLALAVLQLQRQAGFSSLAGLALSQEQERSRAVPDEDFKKMVLYAFESLVQSLIIYASSELRKIKQKQEDVVLANVRSDRSRTLRASTPHGPRPGPEAGGSSSTTTPRTDIATLFSLIGLLYTALPPEHALPFWGASPHPGHVMYSEHTTNKLPQFLQWAAWSTQARDIGMTTALYDMLAGIAHGQQCSELAYNFLARGGSEVLPGSAPASTSSAYSERSTVSWIAIFDLLESWTSSAAARPLPAPQQPSASVMFTSHLDQAPSASQRQPAFELGPSHVVLAQSFLRLLSTVVRCSVTVRLAITGNSRFRAIPTLVSLIPLGIPLEMKGALFETLSSFCEPGAGAPGIEICKAEWTLMERLEVINVRATRGGFTAPHTQGKGVELELEEVETAYKFYPATIPFLKLLSTLIHSQKRIPLKSRLTEAEPINTIPESLGLPYRLPGIGPFVSFVLDTVFAKIPMREYLRQSDRWQINDLCLTFVERCLASYDLENLVSLVENRQLAPDSMVPFLVHPGYDIMKRLLTSSPFQDSILSYIVEGVEGFDRQFADEEPFFHSTIVRVLRIVLRVLEIQDSFLDILIPASAEFDCVDIIGTVHPRSYFTRFDYALSLGRQFVPALISYVAHPKYAELVLLSVKITAKLSSSQAFPNLLTFVERSSESDRILSGFRQLMDVESLEDVDDAVAAADNSTGAGAPGVGGPHVRLDQAIRLAALDLFIQDTHSSRPYPNIGHFLLFGGYGRDFRIQNPHALGSRQTCIHVILDLLNEGIPRRVKGESKLLHPASEVDALFITLPALAERCYKVVYQLCTHPKTFEFVMRYLRTQEDFFARHIAVIPAKAPETLQEPFIEVLYADSIRVTTTVSALSSFLRLRSWIIDLVALDLHVLTNKGHHKSVGELLEIFFGDVSGNSRHSDGMEDHALHGLQKLGQSHLQIIEFLQSLNFDWFDSLTVTPIDLDLLKGIDLQSCIREDETGCEIVDRVALLSLLNSTKRSLHSRGRIVTQAHAEQLRAEINYVLESCAVENHRRAVQHSVTNSFEAWRRLLDIILTKCFQRIPHDRRENMLFDLLRILPNALRSPNVEKSSAVLLSEVVLSSITKLREDRCHQIVIQSAGGDAGSSSLPSERLYHLFRNILECIMDYTHLELVRGNLYASLINYFHLIAPEDMETEGTKQNALAISLTASTSSIYSFTSSGSINGTSQASLVKSTLAIMKQIVERFVNTISRDAIDGTEVWKTIAFTCLDSLVQLSHAGREQIVVSAMVRQGILSNFVVGLTDSDLRLQGILKPEPGKELYFIWRLYAYV